MTLDLAERKTPWRDNIEAVGAAVVIALMLKAFALEAYKIPTGSMQPTLMGFSSPTVNVFDRIVVDKFSYQIRDPKRFEVAVFRYPLDRSKNFVKRIVGMPNEDLRVLNGDLWVRPEGTETWSVLRRPDAVMAEHWKRLDDPWMGESGDVAAAPDALVARSSGVFRFGANDRPIMDDFFDGYPKSIVAKLPPDANGGPLTPLNRRAQNYVGDLAFEGDVEAGTDLVSLTFVLSEGPRTYRFHVPGPAAPADARAKIDVETRPSDGIPGDATPLAVPSAYAPNATRLAAGARTAVRVHNLDDQLLLTIDGQEPLVLDVPPIAMQDGSLRIEFRGTGRVLEPRVWRDVYYTARGTSQWSIPADKYVVLGDNTQDSSDSREWQFERYSADGGERILRGNQRQDENPLRIGDDRDSLFFVDEWGQRHWLARGAGEVEAPWESVEQLPAEFAPFVGRELVTGRALAVFWPIQPLDGIVRLEWVH
jgi:signal peptidase I